MSLDFDDYPSADGEAEQPEELTVAPDTPEPERRPLPILTISELANRRPAKPIVEGLVYANTLCQLTGNPGSYKSFITLGIACAVATQQRSWEGFKVKGGNVIYIAAEGGDGIALRAKAWCYHNRIDPEELHLKLFVIPEPVSLNPLLDAKDQWVQELIEVARDNNVVLIIWDTRSLCTPGMNENDAQEMSMAIRVMDRVRRETGAAQMPVHHSARSGTAGRGSNTWDGAVWSDLRLEKKDGLMAEVKVEKHKDVEIGGPYIFRLAKVTIPQDQMPEATESQRTTLVPTQSDGHESGDTLSANDQLVIDAVTGTGGLTRNQIADELAGKASYATVKRSVVKLIKTGVLIAGGARNAYISIAQESLLDD